MNEALIIFVRNPALGQVKTRLAVTMGNEKALAAYNFLLAHTKNIVGNISAKKFVFYADFVNENDLWDNYDKNIQQGNDLGERMENAFDTVMKLGFKKVCIIGSDCYELSSAILAEAFKNLDMHAVTIGPAVDGGYYLLGMQAPVKNIFNGILWSTDQVFKQTQILIVQQDFSLQLLPILTDVDEEADIKFTF
jgi:rSAM/selenodomain-associated transferase 1